MNFLRDLNIKGEKEGKITEWSELMKGKAFITDLGETQVSVVEKKEVTVGRYAVWSPLRGSQNHQVIEVGNDLAALKAKYNIPEERVCYFTAG